MLGITLRLRPGKERDKCRILSQANYTPYGRMIPFWSLLEDPWGLEQPQTEMFKVREGRGVYDMRQKKYLKGIDVYGPGYIDKGREYEVIVGFTNRCSAETCYLPR